MTITTVPEMTAGSEYWIAYLDAAGNYSERTIAVEDVFAVRGVTFVRSFCYTANACRTFRYDRVCAIRSCPLPPIATFAQERASAFWLPILSDMRTTVYATA